MHKGLYWSQLITGIGVGFIVAALIWIFAEHYNLEELLFSQSETAAVQYQREIVFYDSSVLTLQVPELVLPEYIEEINESTCEDIQENVDSIESTESLLITDTDLLEEQVTQEEQILQEEQVTQEESVSQEEQVPQDELLSDGETNLIETVPEVEEIVYFVVNPGDTAEEIAIHLEKLGLVSGKEFLHLVYVKNLDRKLKIGHYEFKKGTLVTEIISQLIR